MSEKESPDVSRDLEEKKTARSNYPKTCGRCGTTVTEAGPCPGCEDFPFGRVKWEKADGG